MHAGAARRAPCGDWQAAAAAGRKSVPLPSLAARPPRGPRLCPCHAATALHCTAKHSRGAGGGLINRHFHINVSCPPRRGPQHEGALLSRCARLRRPRWRPGSRSRSPPCGSEEKTMRAEAAASAGWRFRGGIGGRAHGPRAARPRASWPRPREHRLRRQHAPPSILRASWPPGQRPRGCPSTVDRCDELARASVAPCLQHGVFPAVRGPAARLLETSRLRCSFLRPLSAQLVAPPHPPPPTARHTATPGRGTFAGAHAHAVRRARTHTRPRPYPLPPSPATPRHAAPR